MVDPRNQHIVVLPKIDDGVKLSSFKLPEGKKNRRLIGEAYKQKLSSKRHSQSVVHNDKQYLLTERPKMAENGDGETESLQRRRRNLYADSYTRKVEDPSVYHARSISSMRRTNKHSSAYLSRNPYEIYGSIPKLHKERRLNRDHSTEHIKKGMRVIEQLSLEDNKVDEMLNFQFNPEDYPGQAKSKVQVNQVDTEEIEDLKLEGKEAFSLPCSILDEIAYKKPEFKSSNLHLAKAGTRKCGIKASSSRKALKLRPLINTKA